MGDLADLPTSDVDDKPSPPPSSGGEDTVSSDTPPSSLCLEDDDELIRQAEEHFREERIRPAARLLRQVQDKERYTELHHEIFKLERYCLDAIEELMSPPEKSWKKQGESHGHRDTIIYFKVDRKRRLTCRIETPIESSLLLPLLSVLNESDLYQTWMPYFKRPFRMGVSHSEQLAQKGRCRQVIKVVSEAPQPLQNRELILDAIAFDDIENGFIVIKIMSLEEGDEDSAVGKIGKPPKGMKRLTLLGNMLLRACPPDHVTLKKSRAKYPPGEKLILVGMTIYVDAHVAGIPMGMINFVTRTLIGRVWGNLIKVAESVRSGDRQEHQEAIEKRKEFYDWADQRIEVMFERLEQMK